MKEPQTLAELIDAAVVRHGKSVRQLAFLAQDNGYVATHTTLNHIRAGRYKSVPTEKTLKAIAWLAGVDEAVAFTAAGQPVPGPPLADDLPPGADNLSAKSRKAVIEMVRVLVDLESANDEHQRITRSRAPRRESDADFRRRTLPAEPDMFDGFAAEAAAVDDRAIAEQKRLSVISATQAAQFKTAVDQALMESAALDPEQLDLAAHPPMMQTRDRLDRETDAAGEENQDEGPRDA